MLEVTPSDDACHHRQFAEHYQWANLSYLTRKQRALTRNVVQLAKLQQRFTAAAERYDVKPRWGSVAFFSKATGRPARVSTRLSAPFGLALRDLCADVDEGRIPRAEAHDRAVAVVLKHWTQEAERLRSEIAFLVTRIAQAPSKGGFR